jgi:hypothetical protein
MGNKVPAAYAELVDAIVVSRDGLVKVLRPTN